ncbi:MAG: rRNA maturation RNase YbeY [Synergistaceae bacterium]|nr:rRNA maturation RNase YbeY [Synergistaceae bacterium]
MKLNVITVGKVLITDKLPFGVEDFLRRIEILYASLLQRGKFLPPSCLRAEVSLSFVESSKIRELNFNYREVDAPTDILSFPLWEEDSVFSPPQDWECLPLGDIVICPERVIYNSSENNKSFIQELVLVMSHGLLHLLGYDHNDSESELRMWAEQDKMVDQFFREGDNGYDKS